MWVEEKLEEEPGMFDEDFQQEQEQQSIREPSNCFDEYYSYDMEENQEPSHVYTIDKLYAVIKGMVQAKQIICNMDFGSTLTLFSFAKFNSDAFDDLIDIDKTGSKIIKFRRNFEVSRVEAQCRICMRELELMSNSCGHYFCQDCYRSYLSVHLASRNLFPLCPQERCYHYTHYRIMEAIWATHPQVQRQFSKLLCLKYCEQNTNIRICPTLTCGKVIDITYIHEPTVSCVCGVQICKNCGKQPHWPLQCGDLNTWDKISCKDDYELLIQNSFKKCPICKQCIEKNDGCLLMTCTCTYQFCWICMKPWKGHVSYISCTEEKAKDEQKMKSQILFIQKNKFFNEDYLPTLHEVQRLSLCLARINGISIQNLKARLNGLLILEIDTDVLLQLKNFISQAWKLIQRCNIYIFLRLENYEVLRMVMDFIQKAADRADDYLFQDFPKKFQENFEFALFDYDEDFLEAENRVNEMLRNEFLQEKRNFVYLMNQSKRMINKIKNGEIWEAYYDINFFESVKYLNLNGEDLFKYL